MTEGMSDKIAQIVLMEMGYPWNSSDAQYTASEIITALPSMVVPLVWDDFDRFMTQSGKYTMRKAPFETYWRRFFGEEFIGHDLDKDILGAKAQAHHVAQIMAAFGGETK